MVVPLTVGGRESEEKKKASLKGECRDLFERASFQEQGISQRTTVKTPRGLGKKTRWVRICAGKKGQRKLSLEFDCGKGGYLWKKEGVELLQRWWKKVPWKGGGGWFHQGESTKQKEGRGEKAFFAKNEPVSLVERGKGAHESQKESTTRGGGENYIPKAGRWFISHKKGKTNQIKRGKGEG